VEAALAARVDFRTVFELEANYVARSLRRLGVRPNDVEDATHEVFVAVHARLGEYDPARPIKPWLFAFAYRVACAEKRRPHRRMDLREELPEVPDERGNADEIVEQNERRALLFAALAALSEEQRAVVVMHEIDGISVPEIAAAFDIPLNTAYSRLRLGREELARAVRRRKELSVR
jgi:RNA polymerase sigma-70 factor (ECF subfamily)